ncbi:hypothetical protein CHUAL_010698 [Chamberlinius hualienensis]
MQIHHQFNGRCGPSGIYSSSSELTQLKSPIMTLRDLNLKMSPTNLIQVTKIKTIGKVQDTKHLPNDKLKSFIKTFQLEVANNNVSLKRQTEECCKSMLYQGHLILNKVPKNSQNVLMKSYFDGCENENLQSHSLPDQISQNVITTLPTTKIGNHIKSTARVLRSRSAKKSGSGESTKKSYKRKATTKTSPRESLKEQSTDSSEDESLPLKEWAEKNRKPVKDVTEVLVGISSNSGRQVFEINDNQPAVILPDNDSPGVVVIQPETSIANLKFDDTRLRDLKLLHKKIGQILKI